MTKLWMKTNLVVLGVILILAATTLPARAGEVIDRIVATVNGHIILQSDWDDGLNYEAFSNGRLLDELTPDDRKGALDRLIDQELLREQIRSVDFQHAPQEEVMKRLLEIRKQYAGSETERGWQAALQRFGLTESQLRKNIVLELDLMRLVDSRLRPTVNIDSKSIESYYNHELLPQLRGTGAKEPPLAEVSPRIRELLTQQKMNQLLTAWLQNLRSGSQIRTEDGSAGAMR
jgi:peptidyl-prolyl cis-trans isomerase SurA